LNAIRNELAEVRQNADEKTTALEKECNKTKRMEEQIKKSGAENKVMGRKSEQFKNERSAATDTNATLQAKLTAAK